MDSVLCRAEVFKSPPLQSKTPGQQPMRNTGTTSMPKLSAGIVLFRRAPTGLEVMLVHPGGPFWAKKDEGAWSIPKSLADEGEDLLAAAKREFLEETGMAVVGEFLDLGAHKQSSGKTIVAWACEGEFDPASLKSDTFSLEWPPCSGRMAEFPEVDRAAWYSIDEAFLKINKGQKPIVAALESSMTASRG